MSTIAIYRIIFEIIDYIGHVTYTGNCPTPITVLGLVKIQVSEIKSIFIIKWNFLVLLSNRNCNLATFFERHSAISIKHTSKPTVIRSQYIRILLINGKSGSNLSKLSQTNWMSNITIYIYTQFFYTFFIMLSVTKCFKPCTSFNTSTIFILNLSKHFFIFTACCNLKRGITPFR
mgnify:CR=1 FL=1